MNFEMSMPDMNVNSSTEMGEDKILMPETNHLQGCSQKKTIQFNIYCTEVFRSYLCTSFCMGKISYYK